MNSGGEQLEGQGDDAGGAAGSAGSAVPFSGLVLDTEPAQKNMEIVGTLFPFLASVQKARKLPGGVGEDSDLLKGVQFYDDMELEDLFPTDALVKEHDAQMRLAAYKMVTLPDVERKLLMIEARI